MQRKTALAALAGLGALAGLASRPATAAADQANQGKLLRPPPDGRPVQVAFVMGPRLVPIDLFGPWTAFAEGSRRPDGTLGYFNLYAVAANAEPIDVDDLFIRPNFSFENAPQPHVLVVPQQKSEPATLAYLRQASRNADVTMSVCTGAFVLANAGLLDGLRATTHHNGYEIFERTFRNVTLVRGVKYVENRDVSTAGGESSGIDLALRVIERYYGAAHARSVAYQMEYRRTPRPQSAADV